MDDMGTYRSPVTVLGCILLCFLPGTGAADGLRCGQKLVKDGDSVGRLIDVCGAPAHKSSGKVSLREAGRTRSVTVQQWFYERGRRTTAVVSLRGGRVVAIELE